MKRLKQAPILFFFSLLLMFSTFFVTPASASSFKKTTSVTFKGEPLFEPFVQADGTLLYGNYNIINGVYNFEIMSVSEKGKKSKVLASKAGRVFLVGNSSAPKLVVLNYDKGTFRVFNTKGKQLWTYSVKNLDDIFFEFDSSGNLYIDDFVKNKIIKVSSSGKQLFSIPRAKEDQTFISNDGSIFVFSFNESKKEAKLAKFNKSNGKLIWKKVLLNGENSLKGVYYLELIEVNHNIYLKGGLIDKNYNSYYKLFAFDGNGKAIWTYTSKDHVWNVKALKDKSIFITGNKYIQLNSKGKKIKEMTIGSNNEEFDVVIDHNGETYVFKNNGLIKLTTSGSIDYKINLKPNTYGRFQNINELVALIPYEETDIPIYIKGKFMNKVKITNNSYRLFITGITKRKSLWTTNAIYNEKLDAFTTTVTLYKY